MQIILFLVVSVVFDVYDVLACMQGCICIRFPFVFIIKDVDLKHEWTLCRDYNHLGFALEQKTHSKYNFHLFSPRLTNNISMLGHIFHKRLVDSTKLSQFFAESLTEIDLMWRRKGHVKLNKPSLDLYICILQVSLYYVLCQVLKQTIRLFGVISMHLHTYFNITHTVYREVVLTKRSKVRSNNQ